MVFVFGGCAISEVRCRSLNPRLLLLKKVLGSFVYDFLQYLIFSICDFVKADSLKSLLAQAIIEKNAISKERSENIRLHERVEPLKERLRESDTKILAQLRTYREDVEASQASIDELTSENESSVAQIPVQEMPWDSWRGLLLRIDALSDFLSQVGMIFIDAL